MEIIVQEMGAVIGVTGLCALTLGGVTWLAKASLTKMMEKKVQDHIASLAMERDTRNLELSKRLEDYKNQLLDQSQQLLEEHRAENQKLLAVVTSQLADEVNKHALIHSRIFPKMEGFVEYAIPEYQRIEFGIIEALTGNNLENNENRMKLLEKWERAIIDERRKLYNNRMVLPKDLHDAFMSFIELCWKSLSVWHRHFVDYPEWDEQDKIPEIRKAREPEREHYKKLIVANAGEFQIESKTMLENIELISRKRLAVDSVFS